MQDLKMFVFKAPITAQYREGPSGFRYPATRSTYPRCLLEPYTDTVQGPVTPLLLSLGWIGTFVTFSMHIDLKDLLCIINTFFNEYFWFPRVLDNLLRINRACNPSPKCRLRTFVENVPRDPVFLQAQSASAIFAFTLVTM